MVTVFTKGFYNRRKEGMIFAELQYSVPQSAEEAPDLAMGPLVFLLCRCRNRRSAFCIQQPAGQAVGKGH